MQRLPGWGVEAIMPEQLLFPHLDVCTYHVTIEPMKRRMWTVHTWLWCPLCRCKHDEVFYEGMTSEEALDVISAVYEGFSQLERLE